MAHHAKPPEERPEGPLDELASKDPGRILRALKHLDEHREAFIKDLAASSGPEKARLLLFARTDGVFTGLLKRLKDYGAEEKRSIGGLANRLKEAFSAYLDRLQAELDSAAVGKEISDTALDMSLPGSPAPGGRIHPLTQTMEEMAGILRRMGFAWAEGPFAESERNSFDALNIPGDHPARDMLDTFYLKTGADSAVLRPHTSPVQIRYMESHTPPLRIMAPGRVFRHEAVDASHSAVFHQIEGLYVDKKVSLADLKGTLRLFLQGLFGPDVKTRFRPSYFPFTEPSAEIDIGCLLCKGAGCAACKRSGWMEILGAGLVHPNVFKAVGYDPDEWSGFAFGVGVERIAMLRLGVTDIRAFYQNDLRFLEQFK